MRYILHHSTGDYGKVWIGPSSITVEWQASLTKAEKYRVPHSFQGYLTSWRGEVTEVSRNEYLTGMVIES